MLTVDTGNRLLRALVDKLKTVLEDGKEACEFWNDDSIIMPACPPNMDKTTDTSDFLLDAPESIREGDHMSDDFGLSYPPDSEIGEIITGIREAEKSLSVTGSGENSLL